MKNSSSYQHENRCYKITSKNIYKGNSTLSSGHIVFDSSGIQAIDDDKSTPNIELNIGDRLLLPGIIDLHGDSWENTMMPRANIYFDPKKSLLSLDKELACSGITTAYLAQGYSWEGRTRSPEAAENFLNLFGEYKHLMQTDVRVQIRLETELKNSAEKICQLISDHNIDYLAFNNHIPMAKRYRDKSPLDFANWAEKRGITVEELSDIVDAYLDNDNKETSINTAKVAEFLRKEGLTIGSHDDKTIDTRQYYRSLGANVCEFPVVKEVAADAKKNNETIIMGAPNVARGGSHTNNIAAEELIRENLCDVLVSDYYLPALIQAVEVITKKEIMPFCEAWNLISLNPAKALRFFDRGLIKIGNRADLVIVNPETFEVEATISNGSFTYLRDSIVACFQ